MVGLQGFDYSNSTDVLYILILNVNIFLIMGLYNSTKNLHRFQRTYYLSCEYLILKAVLAQAPKSTPRHPGNFRLSCPVFGSFLE